MLNDTGSRPAPNGLRARPAGLIGGQLPARREMVGASPAEAGGRNEPTRVAVRPVMPARLPSPNLSVSPVATESAPSATPSAPRRAAIARSPIQQVAVAAARTVAPTKPTARKPKPTAAPTLFDFGSLEQDGGTSMEPAPQPQAPAAPVDRFEELTAKVSRIIYKAPEGGYTVYAVKPSKGKETVVSSSSPVEVAVGDKIIAKGSWTEYKGRPTFKAAMLMQDIPKGAKGVVTWLKTRAAEGVGDKVAANIGRYFGDRIEDVIHDPKLLMEAATLGKVNGFTREKAEAIADAWNNNANQPELIAFLGRFAIGEMTIAKIIRRYGAAAKRIIDENPWILAETVDGVGFQTSDQIAQAHGHSMESPARIKAGVIYVLSQMTNRDGHCGIPRGLLVQEVAKLLRVRDVLVAARIGEVVDDGKAIDDREAKLVYPPALHKAEHDMAADLERLLVEGDRSDPDEARALVEEISGRMGIDLDPSQVEAAVMAISTPLSVITGGPGTGKSTVQKVVVAAFGEMKREVALAAPTGRAAKRLSEVSGKPAGTCHRLLSFNAEAGGFTFTRKNRFQQDRFVVDEFSMVDVRLGSSFVEAVKPTAGLVIVGDVDQLPSVGPGQVLRDLIEAGAIPVARLTKVHRQASNSGIVVAAHRINAGLPPIEEGRGLTGFDIDEIDDAEAIRQRVVSLMRDVLPAKGYDPIRDVQVLAAFRRGDLGIEGLNEVIKGALNPSEPGRSVEFKGRSFAIGDRVMHLKNDYVKRVYNGEVGTVVWTGEALNERGKSEPSMRVDYSGHSVGYLSKDVDDVELSWAATVHKSQGCEFPVVVFVVPRAHRRMLTRNLIYTAVTRAKVECIVVGHEDALIDGIANVDTTRRHTGLTQAFSRNEAADPVDEPAPAPRFA